MNINHLNEEVMGHASVHDQTLIRIGDKCVCITGNNRQTNRCEYTVGIDTKLMTSNGGGRPTTVVQQHVKSDVLAVQCPIERNVAEFVSISIKERWIESQLAIGRNSTPFTIKGDEREASRSNIEGGIGDKHSPGGVVKPTSIKPPRDCTLCLKQNKRGVRHEFGFISHGHGNGSVHHPAVTFHVFRHEFDYDLVAGSRLPR